MSLLMNSDFKIIPLASVLLLGVALLGGCATPVVKLSRTEAQGIALAKVPGGTVKEGELEKEHGRLVWSFDLAKPSTANITEIQVDAQTGEIVLQEIETPADERTESAKGKK